MITPKNSNYESLVTALRQACLSHYGDRLVTLAIYGSFARDKMKYDSDLDLLIIASNLPQGRIKRVEEFIDIERILEPELKKLRVEGIHTYLSPIFKSPEEAAKGSPLFFDMTDEIVMLYDRGDFFKNILDRLRARMKFLGSKRVWKGDMWYWILKPDIKPGEIIEI